MLTPPASSLQGNSLYLEYLQKQRPSELATGANHPDRHHNRHPAQAPHSPASPTSAPYLHEATGLALALPDPLSLDPLVPGSLSLDPCPRIRLRLSRAPYARHAPCRAGAHINGNCIIAANAQIGDGCMLGPDVVIGTLLRPTLTALVAFPCPCAFAHAPPPTKHTLPRAAGKDCRVADGVKLSRCILLEGSVVQSHAVVLDSIIGWRATVTPSLSFTYALHAHSFLRFGGEPLHCLREYACARRLGSGRVWRV
jgi:hypothetical protein